MTKDFVEMREAKAAPKRGAGKGVKSGEDLRRTQPKDQGPASVAEVDALFKRDEFGPKGLNGPDGLVTASQYLHEEKCRGPQDPVDQHDDNYANDVKDGWLRGSGLRGATARPDFDHGKYDLGNKPDRHASGGLKNTASGQDAGKGKGGSPFSSAYRKGAGEGY